LRKELTLTFNLNLRKINEQRILSDFESHKAIELMINSGDPFLVSRFGSTESQVLLENRSGDIHPESRENLWKLSGVFPNSIEISKKYAEAATEAALQIDVCGTRCSKFEYAFWDNERATVSEFAPHAVLVDIEVLAPIDVRESWVKALENKKVLVIHPFAETIQRQYLRRKKLFTNSDWLPEFKLMTMRSTQSLSGTPLSTGHADWFSALDSMKIEIQQFDFDIALIGAGAYGMNLGAYIKGLGKQAMHIGGALQLFFGIKGFRWTNRDEPTYLEITENPNWVWPSQEEIPSKFLEVERGAYWNPDH
jgi:hypothetical protein